MNDKKPPMGKPTMGKPPMGKPSLNMATVKKRGNTFQITVSLGTDVHGKKIRKTTT